MQTRHRTVEGVLTRRHLQPAPGGLEGAPQSGSAHPRHSQIAMTMEFYAEASEEEVRAALGKLSEAMGGAD